MLWFLDRIMQRCVCYKSGGDVKPIITEDMRASAEVSSAQWNDYQIRFAPFEQRFMDDVTRDTGTTSKAIQGQVNADLQQKMASKTGPVAGHDPSRGGALPTTSIAKGLSAGQTQALAAVENQKAQNLNTVVGLGRGQAVDAVSGMSDLAVSSGQTALSRAVSDATDSMNERGATMQLIGQGLGVAGAAGSSYFSGANAASNNVINNTANTAEGALRGNGYDALALRAGGGTLTNATMFR